MKKILGTLAVAAAITLTCQPANALEYVPYLGLSYNYSNLSNNNLKEIHNNYNSVSFNLGTSYSQYFGTEMFYLRSFNSQKRFSSSVVRLKSNYNAYGLDLMGYLPLVNDKSINLIGTVGIGEYEFNNKYLDSKNHSDTGIGYRMGLGLQYSINKHWSIRGIARYVTFEKTEFANHMMDYSIGIKYSF